MGKRYFLPIYCSLLVSGPTFLTRSPQHLPAPAPTVFSRLPHSTTEYVVVEGVVEPILITPLVTSTHGWVRQVFFEEGDYVRRRQILLKVMSNVAYSNQFNRYYTLAPRTGFVVRKNAAVGEHKLAGARVADLQDVSQVKVVVAVPPAVGRSLRLCDPVTVHVAELPTRRFTGVVDQLRRPTPARSSYLLTVTMRNHVSPLIRPRMHARVLLPAHRTPAAVAKR